MNEKIKRKLLKVYKKTVGAINNRKIKNKDITIISNNCWGGIFYRNNNLEYLSPTLGLFFIAEEYIKFIYNMKYYLEQDIDFINLKQSKYKDYLEKLNYNSPIGKIDDVEIMFLHYKNEEEAKEKWNRRKKRINWDKIIYKFSDQNMCTYKHLKQFNDFQAEHKICFTTRKYENLDTIQIKEYEKNENVGDDIKHYKKYFNVYKYLNKL